MTPSAWSPVLDVFQADTQDSDTATAQTIAAMCQHIHRAAKDKAVLNGALQAVTRWSRRSALAPLYSGVGLEPAFADAGACFWWAKYHVKVLPHSEFKALLAAYPQKRQLLIPPDVVLRAPNPAGDCSTFSMLIAALLESLSVAWELVTVAADPHDRSLYSHVFVRAVMPDGGRLTLDGSHGKYPGWEVPRAHQFRRQVWDEDGEPVVDSAPVVSQLHAYRMRGMGQDDDSGGTYTDYTQLPGAIPDTSSLTLNLPGLTTPSTGIIDLGVLPGGTMSIDPSTGGYVVPSQSSTAWAQFATALAKGGMTLAEINAIQPGTVVGANGQILRQSTGYPVSSAITTALGSSSTMLLVAGVAAFALIMALMSSRR